MMGAIYKTKKELKAAIGQTLRYEETSMFGEEYRADGRFCVGPSPRERKPKDLVDCSLKLHRL